MTTAQREARNAARFHFWRRLNEVPDNVYLRFQRMTARHHGGKWLRGIVIDASGVRFKFQ